MTRFSDLPENAQHGTLTACRKCGRIAIFGSYRLPPDAQMDDDDGANKLDMDRWKCGGCGEKNESPVREQNGRGPGRVTAHPGPASPVETDPEGNMGIPEFCPRCGKPYGFSHFSFARGTSVCEPEAVPQPKEGTQP